MKENPIKGTNYFIIDPFKRRASMLAAQTSEYLHLTNANEISESRGETAFIWEEEGIFRAQTFEGLGTKNLVADSMANIMFNEKYYEKIAFDTVATVVNDLVAVGARPQIISMGVSAGLPEWFGEKEAFDFLNGWKKACDEAQVTWGGGESQALTELVIPGKAVLLGSGVGKIGRKSNLILGENLRPGNIIMGVESNGIHANGLTDARGLAKNMPSGFLTKLPSGEMFGEVLLKPSHIYARMMNELRKADLSPNYVANITGHGWQKIMRHTKELSYVIENVPRVNEEFDFIQKNTEYTDEQMYRTFNMGIGYTLFVDEDKLHKTKELIEKTTGFRAYKLGRVKEGSRSVEIKPLGVHYTNLGVR